MSRLEQRHPAVVLGGLNLLRPLGFAGIPAIVATPDAQSPALASRYCAAACLLPPLAQRAAAVQALVRLGETMASKHGQRLPLLYGNDDAQGLVQDCREALAPYFHFIVNEPAVGRALLDKDLFQTLAAERGLPVPRLLRWEDLPRVEGAVLVKPRLKFGWGDSAIHLQLFEGAGKARIFASGRDAAALPLVAQLRDELLFQEYLAGDDRNLASFHGFSSEKGEVLAWFTGRKFRTWPALTGATSYLEITQDEEVALAGLDAAQRLGLKGVFKMDFKKDLRTGRYRLLEVNARFNLWHHAGARNGLNLPLVAYEYLAHGRRPASQDYGTAVRWLCLDLDYRAYRELASRGELTLPRWLWSLASAPKVYDLFSWTDPMPFLQHLRRHWMPRITRKVTGWPSTAS